ncbi:MAG: hypothetical protein O9282_13310 [Flavobacterium sp.]|jgi:hypothetical protein|uniref:hypothetical protein n=1 Tax=Flavobacterium TaxID=237 RepID=UPI0022CACF27|nr:hypothetical protein [Flavobacterium sp.]MCZ8090421.1 hypothetical protein [Flavobacterium sp.]MCZ8332284.1 hypothetical protein [Flavobacterium sp.]
MLDFLKNKKESEKVLIGIGICTLIILFGYTALYYASSKEDLFLGHTFFILIGTTLVAVGGLGIVLLLKYLYDYRRRQKRKELKRKKHKITFLKKENKQ